MSLLQWLQHIDETMFIFVHHTASVPFLDNFMLLMRNANTWIPLYAFMLFWSIKFGKPYTIIFIACTLITFALGDYISSGIIKNLVARTRPCDAPSLARYIRHIIGCGGYSMPSSHATNHFALATFWFLAIKKLRGRKWYWLWFWAALVSYAQVYVGKHYPFDVLAGTALGILIGLGVNKLFEYAMKQQDERQKSKTKSQK